MRYTFHRLANEGEGAELATSGFSAYLIHHSESHHHPEGRCRRLETFEEKSDGNLMDRRGRGLSHHCLKFYSLCQNHEASEWQSLSCIHILLIFTLVFFGREKRMGSFTIKKKKKKLFTHSTIVIEHLYVPATVLSLELVLNNIEKSTCFMETYLLAGEIDNKPLTKSIKTSTTGYGWQRLFS